MEIVAKTSGGVLINATDDEIKQILKSVNGNIPDRLEIGQKIPAMDYALTIKNVKGLASNGKLNYMFDYLKEFNEYSEKLKDVIKNASEIEG